MASREPSAWPYLSSPDRFLRFAARTVLEFQDPKTWQDRALRETDPVYFCRDVNGWILTRHACDRDFDGELAPVGMAGSRFDAPIDEGPLPGG